MQFCLNLPRIRFRNKNFLTLGWIRGLKEAWDKPSFFYPIVREGRMLAGGIDFCDANLWRDTKIHVHYVLVGAVLPGRRELMCSLGHQGKNFCEYCTQMSVKGRAWACPPHLPPLNALDYIHKRKAGLEETPPLPGREHGRNLCR